MNFNASCFNGSVLTRLMRACQVNDHRLSKETGVPCETIVGLRFSEDMNLKINFLRSLAAYFSISITQLLGEELLSEDRLLANGLIKKTQVPIIVLENSNSWSLDKLLDGGVVQGFISTDLPVSSHSFCFKAYSTIFKGVVLIVDPRATVLCRDYILVRSGHKGVSLERTGVSEMNSPSLDSVDIASNKTQQDRHLLVGPVIARVQQNEAIVFEKPKFIEESMVIHNLNYELHHPVDEMEIYAA